MNKLATVTTEIIESNKDLKMLELTKQDISALLRHEIKKALNRLGRKQIDPDVLKIAIEDTALDLTTKYRNLTIKEVGIAFREGARRGDDQIFSSRSLAKWLDFYTTTMKDSWSNKKRI